MVSFTRAIFASILLAGVARADIIYLSDGRRLEGDMKREGGDWIITGADGKTTTVATDQVTRIELSGKRATPAGSGATAGGQDGLNSLRRASENLTDISQIIDRYTRFIGQAAGTPVEAEAKKDLDVWQQRQAQGLVKADNRWVTPAERDALRGKAIITAGQARELIKANQWKEAETVLAQAISQDPQCVPALYLRGYVQIKQNQIADARKSLDAAAAIMRDHAPTLNNLAIVMYKQNQFPSSMTAYDQAMLAAPSDPVILTNVAEALHGMTDDQRNSPPAKKAQQDLAAQQPALDAQMGQKGLHRWGAVYLHEDEYARVLAADKEIKQNLDAMAKDFDTTKARIDQIDATISANNTLMIQLQNQTNLTDSQGRLARDSNGRLVQTAPTAQYYQVQADNQRLATERVQATAHLEELRRTAKQEQQKIPVPPFSGLQQPIGVEGTPVMQVGK